MKRFIQFSIACLAFWIISSNLGIAQGSLVLKSKTSQNVLFQIYITKDGDNESVKVCREGQPDDSCQTSSRPLMGNYDLASFNTLCFNMIKGKWAHNLQAGFETDPAVINRMTAIYETWRTNSLENTIRYLQSDQPAGVIILTDEYITLKKSGEKNGETCCPRNVQTTQETKLEAASFTTNTPVLKIKRVAFTISDNFINKITIVGDVLCGNKCSPVVITNPSWSLSLRSFQGQSTVFYKEGNDEYKLCYCELFRYEPHTNGAFNFYVRDEEFTLKPGESKVLTKRNLDDYIGINITSDFLGINTNNANNLLNTEINAVLPLNTSQVMRNKWFPYTSVLVSFGVVDGVSGKNELLPVFYSPNRDFLYVDYFDLIRYQNIQTDLYLGIYGVEIKKVNTVFHFGLGSEFYRTGLQHKIVNDTPGAEDEIINFSAFSATPYLRAIAQWRPDKNFGADLKFDLLKFMMPMNFDNQAPRVLASNSVFDSTGVRNYIPIENFGQRRLFSSELDLYAHVGGKAGLFARFGLDVARVKPGKNIFPRILVGYSTNLDAYINKDPGK